MRNSFLKKEILFAFSICAVVAILFTLIRSTTVLVWDDTSALASLSKKSSMWGEWETSKNIFRDSFGSVAGAGYRPLSIAMGHMGMSFFSNPKANWTLWFAGAGLVFGLLGSCSFLVARRYTQTNRVALFATFLFLCSSPLISGGWIVMVGLQSIVPLAILIGLLLYWKILESSTNKGWYIAALCVVLLTGPWFREFVGLLPLLIAIQEFQRVGYRLTWITGIAGVFFLHAIFPTAIVKLLAFPDLPLQPIYSMGLLGLQVQSSVSVENESFINQVISSLNWSVPLQFLSLYSPILWGLIFISYCFFFQYQWKHLSIVTIVVIAALIISFKTLFGSLLVWLSLFLATTFSALKHERSKQRESQKQVVFLSIWFCLSFLPFLKIFTQQVHLAYALFPSSILIALSIERLWEYLQFSNRKYFLSFFAFLIIVVVGDRALDVYGSYKVVHGMNNGILTMAEWFKENTPPESIVISNVFHSDDIRLYSNGHFSTFWSNYSNYGLKSLDNSSKLERLLKKNFNKHKIYFLDVDFEYPLDKVTFHAHKYVRNQSVAMKNLGLIHTTQARYPYLDPFKAFIPRPFISFLGAPDLQNDFYRGPAQDGTPFMREVYAEYHVYEVIDTEVDPWDSQGLPQIVQAGYRGFNVWELNNRFFAIPQTEGNFNIGKLWKKEYSVILTANSEIEIFAKLVKEPTLESAELKNIPILIEQDYKGFNLIKYGGKVYAIPKEEKAFDIERIQKKDYSHFFVAESSQELKKMIDEAIK